MINEVAPSAAPSRVHRPAPWPLLLLVIAVVITACGIWLYQQRAVDVEVTTPKYEDIESTVSATGTVIPLEEFPARATFAGIVDKIDVRLGQHVRPGEMLVQLRDQYAASRVDTARAALKTAELNDENVRRNGSKEDRIAATSDLERAKAEQASAETSLSTLKQLRQEGSASDAEVSAAAQRLESANAALESANERLQSRYRPEDLKNAEAKIRADRASLAAEQVSYKNANIASPIAGTVYLIPVKQYDFVQMGTDLLHVADLNKLAIDAKFFEPDIKQLKAGEPVRITWNGAPGQVWHGRIQAKPMAVSGDGVFRGGQCTIGLTDASNGLPVNTSVTVIAVVDKHSHVMTLPREAVHTEGSSHFVYAVDGSQLRRIPVQTGLVNSMRIEITMGLRSTDQIALRAMNDGELKNNMRIRAEMNSQTTH